MDPSTLSALEERGLPVGAVLGSGMEGVVLELDDDRVVKVWHGRARAEVDALHAFTTALAAARLPIATPQVLEVVADGDLLATVERRLRGRPLRPAVGEQAPVTEAEAVALADVLAALAQVAPDATLSTLAVLGAEPPFSRARSFAEQLADLVDRRVARSQDVLQRAVPDVRAVAALTVERLRALGPRTAALVHGDLIPANVLVDDRGRPTAVLDFGFLTTIGDPAFDAAVTASVFDMYGPHARASEARLDVAFAGRLHHDPRLIGLYRAAYALATSTEFSPSGEDGHFAWCARTLRREDVRGALAA